MIGFSLQDRVRRTVPASGHAHFGNVGVEPGSNDRADQVLVRRIAGNLRVNHSLYKVTYSIDLSS